ncbi:MAG: hypothetical protein COS09_01875 [Candidatus Nealsonbacteria bacterium CG01_land_8_20_14_3_00_12]|uniref:Uncharacterized protein n=4 Tax=Candidatus Nealsoniibacteriota TaxID=1817911 RepID=A0A2M7EBB2_9BACT|nr:MAG: hypothetical protein COS09_01875 [Candidatus Nealsonbacteria bacterium CG01_land_8_20_14_3_00_12]PIW34707.1 MAG: hypothetical protein COW25_02495 [Candidatus Nealsonbacteria bacterium CG15_BIG_FIL_POST_REV_8_21_14_020_37_12]PJA83481.1 MAG: hypothetical protein CO146_01105 [Candidatus Nealsonbacteria bacterium CG_4_9_14_3_um_filter_37_29]
MPEGNENQKPTEVVSIQSPWRIFAIEAFLFCLTIGLGIAAAFKINEILKIKKITPPEISLWQFIFYFLLATFLLLLILHFVKFQKGKGVIFKILFALSTFLGGLLFLEAWLPEPAPLILIVFFYFWWWKSPTVLNQDILMILGMAGVGSVLGLSLNPEIVAGLLVIFSIYDFIAVYKTKHMVKMAKEMIESKAILALVIPPNIFGFQESLGKIRVPAERVGGKFLVLGGGDIVFPLLFSASLIPVGILNSLIVAFFSLIGLFVGFYFFTSQKIRQPIPALPPIAFFSIIGYLITKIL